MGVNAMLKIGLVLLAVLILTLIMTPVVKWFSIKIGATDFPSARKVHIQPIPTLGGLAIFFSFLVGVLILQPVNEHHLAILVGAAVLIILGVFDDLYNLTARAKFIIQLLVALLVVFGGGLQVEFINLPFGGQVEFGWLSPVITVLWIVGITNAINLIDGLDGLAAGVSAIALITIAGMALIMGNVYVATLSLLLFFSTVGFLSYNFYPAKIFMGDTGALFLGYMISVLALLGFKNVAVISFLVPIFILGVPISDTLLAMIRRLINRQPIASPDSSHLHHRLIKFGLTHKQSVLFIYMLSSMFSLAAILFSMTTLWGMLLIITLSLIVVLFLVETLELISSEFKPLAHLVRVFRER